MVLKESCLTSDSLKSATDYEEFSNFPPISNMKFIEVHLRDDRKSRCFALVGLSSM